jgi:hypothetical protein
VNPPNGLHRCPGRCGRNIRRPACTRCLARLPDHLRTALIERQNATTPTQVQLWANAVEEARDWLLEHPAPPDPDHKIAGECEHCYEPLLWLPTAAGPRLAVNADPDPVQGTVVRTGKVGGVLASGQAAAARRGGTPLWRVHVETCRYPERWEARQAEDAARRERAGRDRPWARR